MYPVPKLNCFSGVILILNYDHSTSCSSSSTHDQNYLSQTQVLLKQIKTLKYIAGEGLTSILFLGVNLLKPKRRGTPCS